MTALCRLRDMPTTIFCVIERVLPPEGRAWRRRARLARPWARRRAALAVRGGRCRRQQGCLGQGPARTIRAPAARPLGTPRIGDRGRLLSEVALITPFRTQLRRQAICRALSPCDARATGGDRIDEALRPRLTLARPHSRLPRGSRAVHERQDRAGLRRRVRSDGRGLHLRRPAEPRRGAAGRSPVQRRHERLCRCQTSTALTGTTRTGRT